MSALQDMHKGATVAKPESFSKMNPLAKKPHWTVGRRQQAHDALTDAQGQIQSGFEKTEAGFADTQAGMQSTIDQGQQAFNQQSALSGAGGAEAQAQAFANFQQSPGQQFLQQRAEKALLRNAAATGGLGGGNTRSALQEQAIGFAQQDFDNQFNRLGQVAGAGQQFQTSLGGWQSALGAQRGQLGAQQVGLGQGISDIYNPNSVKAKAPKGPSTGAQVAGAVIGGIMSDIRLKDDINKVGEYKGVNFFNWEWNKAAEEKYGLTGRSFGVLAQEVEKTHPEFVISGTYKSIDSKYFDTLGIH